MTNASLRILIYIVDQLLNSILTVSDDKGRFTKSRCNEFPIDHKDSKVVAANVLFNQAGLINSVCHLKGNK